MIFLGLVVTLAAIVVGVAVVLENTGEAQVTVFGDTVPGITEQWHVFMAGAVVAIVLMAGLMVAALGFKRAMNMRRELRELRDEHEESLQTLEMERRKLQQALAQARRQGGGPQPSSARLNESPLTDVSRPSVGARLGGGFGQEDVQERQRRRACRGGRCRCRTSATGCTTGSRPRTRRPRSRRGWRGASRAAPA